MIFEKAHRSMTWSRPFALETACEQICHQKTGFFKCNRVGNRLVLRKKPLYAFPTFNYGNLSASMVQAKSAPIRSDGKELSFTIEVQPFFQFITYAGSTFILLIALWCTFHAEYTFGGVILIAAIIILAYSRFNYQIGKKYFLKQWDDNFGA